MPETARQNRIFDHLSTLASPSGWVDYAVFSKAALFLPDVGYYAQARRQRVGKNAASDFYTASTLGAGVFAKLLLAAFESLLGSEFCRSATVVEIACEPDAGLFSQHYSPFAKSLALPLGSPLKIPAQAVVFANEWLDAQPFHRFVRTENQWRELGLHLGPNGELTEGILPASSAAARHFIDNTLTPRLAETPVGSHFDISLEAERMLAEVCAQPWQGAFVTGDYGHTFEALLADFPEGTARAYRRHRVSGDLLSNMGDSDLTCDVCWDRLEKVLFSHGFPTPQTMRQEVFFMRHAQQVIADIVEHADRLSPEKRALMELLHPGQLGARFQVMSGCRMAIERK